jgi:hypothetical protein
LAQFGNLKLGRGIFAIRSNSPTIIVWQIKIVTKQRVDFTNNYLEEQQLSFVLNLYKKYQMQVLPGGIT